jgi:hypothetical protein
MVRGLYAFFVRTRWAIRILFREGGLRHPHRILVGTLFRDVPDPFRTPLSVDLASEALRQKHSRKKPTGSSRP